MSFLLKIENIAKSSKILISGETFFLRSKDRSRTHDQKGVFRQNILEMNEPSILKLCHFVMKLYLYKYNRTNGTPLFQFSIVINKLHSAKSTNNQLSC